MGPEVAVSPESSPAEDILQREMSRAATVAHSPGRRVMRRFARNKLAIVSLAILAVLIVAAVFAPWLAPLDPVLPDFDNVRQAPTAGHLLGTDDLGRDTLSRVIYAARISLTVGLVAVGIYEVIAVFLGAISGYFGGVVDMIVQRVVDVVMSFPSLIIILVAIAILGPSIYNVMIVIGFLSWPGPTRLVRGQILQLREQDYILAAHCIGVPDRRIIMRHILPGVVSPLVVNATFGVASAIMLEAALSFLGLGVQPPTPTWGNMLMDAQNLTKLRMMPWLWVPPGVAIVVTVSVINFIGDGLRDALDPKQLET